jgi:hypothetical protein
MDSPRYRLEGSPVGGYELDDAALGEMAEELDKEDPGWEDADKHDKAADDDKDDPFERLDRLEQQQPASDFDAGRGMYSSPVATTPGSLLLNELDGDGGDADDDGGPVEFQVRPSYSYPS